MTTIRLRRDPSATWGSTNPILESGEPGVETDTGGVKVGDGSTAWNLLPYTNDSTIPLGTLMRPGDNGPYATSDLTTYTLTTSAPAFTGMVGYPWNTSANRFRVGGLMVDAGASGINSINGATDPGFSATGYEIECDVESTEAAIMFKNYGTEDFRCVIDDICVKPNWEHVASSNVWYLRLGFAAGKKNHRVRWISKMPFAQLLLPATGKVWPAPPRFRVAIIGDSFAHGGDSLAGNISAGTLAGELALQTGWEVWNLAQGGSGYIEDAGGVFGIQVYGGAARLAALAALPPMDLIMVYGGANDGIDIGANPVATTRTAARNCWTAIKAARPTTPLVVWGVEAGVYPSVATDLNTLNAGLKAEALAHPGVIGYVDSRVGTTYPGQWVTGTGNESTPTGDGSADMVTASDGVHPTHYGFALHTRRGVEQLARMRIPVPA